MGRKLTSYERSVRDRERENERAFKADVVSKRQAAAKKEKQTLINNDRKQTVIIVKEYEEFQENIENLHRSKLGGNNFIKTLQKVLIFDKSTVKRPQDNYISKPFKFSKQSLLTKSHTDKNSSIPDFKNDSKSQWGYVVLIIFAYIFGWNSWLDSETGQDMLKALPLLPLFAVVVPIILIYLNRKRVKKKNIKEEQKFIKRHQKIIDDASSLFLTLENEKSKKKKSHEDLEKKRQIKEKEDLEERLKKYDESLKVKTVKFDTEEEERIIWVKKLVSGDLKVMQEALELMVPIMFEIEKTYLSSDPNDVLIGYEINSNEDIKIALVLESEFNFLPENKIKIKPSGNGYSEIKNTEKDKKQTTDKVICSMALAYIKGIMNVLPTVKTVYLEIGYSGEDPKTGGLKDLVMLQVKVERKVWKDLNINKVDPIIAMDNFDYKFASISSKLRMDSNINRDEIEWATKDDSNITIAKHVSKSFKSNVFK